MTEEELFDIIKNHESDRIELTKSVEDKDKICEAICAFSNDFPAHKKPGYFIIGINNDLKIAGISVNDKMMLTWLGWFRGDGVVQPIPSISIEKITTSSGDVAVLKVLPSLLPPVRYKGKICIRNGPRRDFATAQEELILTERRISKVRTFDALPCLDASISNLSLPLFKIEYQKQVIAHDVLEENHRPIEQQLASLRFYDIAQNCPTNAGVILFGMNPREHLPGAYVQFLKVSGNTLASDVLNERMLSGDLHSMMRELDALVAAYINQFPVEETLLRERNVESYPRVAVRELLMNAVMHRDYASTAPLRVTWLEDRVEIQSPGGLYGEASPENFPTQTSYRNPVLAEALKALGYVNRYGRGVIRAQDALAKNGSRPAEFRFDHGFVLVTIWRRQ